MKVTGVVLAGGLSRRMGRDKSRVIFGSRTMLEIAVVTLRAAGCDVVVVLHRDLDLVVDATVHTDLGGGHGPLDGLATAMTRAETPLVLTLPVDLPRVSVDDLRATVDRLQTNTSVDAVLLWDGADTRQHLAGAWRTDPCREVLTRCFADGERSVRRAVALLEVEWRIVPASTLHNVNTPSDLTGPAVT